MDITTWPEARDAIVRACRGRGMTGADADDAAQDTVLGLWTGPGLDGIGQALDRIAKGWRIAGATVEKEARRNARLPRVSMDAVSVLAASNQPGPELLAMAREEGIPEDGITPELAAAYAVDAEATRTRELAAARQARKRERDRAARQAG